MLLKLALFSSFRRNNERRAHNKPLEYFVKVLKSLPSVPWNIFKHMHSVIRLRIMQNKMKTGIELWCEQFLCCVLQQLNIFSFSVISLQCEVAHTCCMLTVWVRGLYGDSAPTSWLQTLSPPLLDPEPVWASTCVLKGRFKIKTLRTLQYYSTG